VIDYSLGSQLDNSDVAMVMVPDFCRRTALSSFRDASRCIRLRQRKQTVNYACSSWQPCGDEVRRRHASAAEWPTGDCWGHVSDTRRRSSEHDARIYPTATVLVSNRNRCRRWRQTESFQTCERKMGITSNVTAFNVRGTPLWETVFRVDNESKCIHLRNVDPIG
jgi:hypothetical protein